MTRGTRAFSSCSARARRPAVQPWRCGWHEEAARNALCRREWARPGRRRCHISWSKQSVRWTGRATKAAQSLSLVLVFCLLFLSQGVNAKVTVYESEVFPRELLFDRREPPQPRMVLERRQDGSLANKQSATAQPNASSTPSGTATESGIATATETAPFTLPVPFDTSIGNNFTSTSCPIFFQNFLSNQTFRDCLPFSLLLQTSNGFFTASRSPLRLTQTLDVTCNVNLNTCSALMAEYAQDIQHNNNCGADLEMRNPMVTQAYNGFVSYQTLYHAGCLTDDSGDYCFANAVTNTSAPSSSYIYYLPLGVKLPGGAQPACNQCLQNTMAVFAQTASNSSQPLHSDYSSAAEQIQMNCGPQFVDSSITNAAPASLPTTASGIAGLVVLFTLLINTF